MIYARSSVAIAAVLSFSTQSEAFFGPMKTPKNVEKPKGPGRSIVDGTTGLPGDVGFDPLSLANIDIPLLTSDTSRSKTAILRDYQDAELKHGRLAMLAAVAFPLQEKFNPLLAAMFKLPNLVEETDGLSPTVLNGGLEQGPIPFSVITFGFLVALVELRGIDIKRAEGDDWVIGDYRSLRIAEPGTEQFFKLQEGEIWNSRIAMMAILAYVAQEFVSGISTADTIPGLGA
uniref:Uncharacterized protein n=2 Tax=Chrysotila carterae TaxID=13221 RepID=A0A7S4EXZ7_CHRCT